MKNKITWHIEKRKLEQLNPYAHNPRKLTDKGMADLKRSIDKFGLAEPIVINTDNTIIGGHARYFTLLKDENSDIMSVDCYVPSRKLTLKEVQELNIRLNKNIAGEFDFDILANEFNLDDLLDWGFEEKELDLNLWNDKTEEQLDDVPEPKKNAVSKLGDIFLIDGKHRVMCGDSTKKEDVEKLMDGKKTNLIHCDPPYNINLSYHKGIGTKGKYSDSKIVNDNKNDFDYRNFIENSLKNILCFASKNVHIFYWCDESYIGLVQKIYEDNKIENKRVNLWIKNNINPTPQIAFNKCYEPCIYGTIGKPYLNNKIRNLSEILNYDISSKDIIENILSIINVWIEKRDDTTKYEHPTQKPVRLIYKPLFRCSNIDDLVVDLFLGSGSTLIACEQTKRICYGMELDPIYIDVILRRYYNLYPEKKIECLTRNDFNLNQLFSNAKD